MTLRSYLTALAIASMIPLALFASGVAYLLVEHERETFSQSAQSRALTFLTAVDSEIDSSFTALKALAATPGLSGDANLDYFRRVASNVLRSQPNWISISLVGRGGDVLMTVPEAKQAAGAKIALEGVLARVGETRQPAVGDVGFDPAFGHWSFPTHAPVVRDGKLKFLLTANVAAESMNAIIAAQRLPEDWGAVILDSSNRFVARNWESEKYVGQLASESLRSALARSASGWFHGRTVEGVDIYSPYWRSDKTGWSVSMGYPASAIGAVANRAAWLLIAGLLLALAVALVLARRISGRIAEPIGALAGTADALARGEALQTAPPTDIDEVRKLAAAMRAAAAVVRERNVLLEREKEALESADRAKDEFLAMLSHELRNPLAALSSAAHVLNVAEPASDAATQARHVVARQTKHMSRLVGDLLDISRITLGRLSLDRERFDLAEAIARLAKTWNASGRFERHRVSLGVTSTWVEADRARIEQVAANLLDNALKFTPPGKSIRVSVAADGSDALLRVADEGIGVAQGDAARVFDLFVSADAAGAGLGIGLALVKQLAELHGGSVALSSPGAGQGAEFVVRLPRVEPVAPYAAATAAAHGAPRSSGGRSVLIVEDNNDARHMLEATLALDGHTVRSAADAASGLALALAATPDVALIDISLPDMDGYELARRLRAAPGGQRIGLVAVTGRGQPDDQRRAFDAGFNAHLVKPVSAERLTQVMAQFS